MGLAKVNRAHRRHRWRSRWQAQARQEGDDYVGVGHRQLHHLLTLPWGGPRSRIPFHPERGQSFRVVNARRAGGIDCLVLRRSAGVFWTVPMDWTDRATPRRTTSSGHFDFDRLLELVELVERLGPNAERVDK